MNQCNIIVYNRHGEPIAEIERRSNISRSYALNKSGQLTFDIPISHPKATRTVLDRGNIVCAYSGQLETWSGHLQKVDWHDNTLTVTRFSAAQKMSDRRTAPLKFKGSSHGDIFRYLVNEANRKEPTGISIGDVWDGGPRIQMDVGAEDPYHKLSELTNNNVCDFRVVMLSPGSWEISLYERIGSDLTDHISLLLGYDSVGAPSYSEDWTTFANSIMRTGKAPSQGSADEGKNGTSPVDDGWTHLPKAEYKDELSIGTYGLVEDIMDVGDVTDLPTLHQKAQAAVHKRSQPLKTVAFSLTERRVLWGQFSEGDTIAVQIPYFGFGGIAVPMRILGRDRKEDSDTLDIVGEVVQGDDAASLRMYLGAHYG